MDLHLRTIVLTSKRGRKSRTRRNLSRSYKLGSTQRESPRKRRLFLRNTKCKGEWLKESLGIRMISGAIYLRIINRTRTANQQQPHLKIATFFLQNPPYSPHIVKNPVCERTRSKISKSTTQNPFDSTIKRATQASRRSLRSPPLDATTGAFSSAPNNNSLATPVAKKRKDASTVTNSHPTRACRQRLNENDKTSPSISTSDEEEDGQPSVARAGPSDCKWT